MSLPTVSVDVADLRRAAGHIQEAAAELDRRLREASVAPSGGSDAWATVAAMGTCAAVIAGQLRAHLAAVTAMAEELRAAARSYDDSDFRAAYRHGRYE